MGKNLASAKKQFQKEKRNKVFTTETLSALCKQYQTNVNVEFKDSMFMAKFEPLQS